MRAPALLLYVLLLAGQLAAPACGMPPAGAPLPAPPDWLEEVDTLYATRIRVAGLEDRRFQPEHWWEIALPLVTGRQFRLEEVGRSVEGRALRHVSWGNGDTSILLWSQMHGDESTASMALADLFAFLATHPRHPLVLRLHRATRLHVLPIVNPDGAARFQRRNAQGIDINRDARALSSPEARALHDLRERVRPDFGFNLHDQRVGYRVGTSGRGTAIALLAPAPNAGRDVDPARARAMEVAVAVRAVLEPYVGGHIARWDDTYNPRAFGDLTAGAGVSTLLIESGGIEGDVQKQRLRRLNFLALLGALDAIATGAHAGLPLEHYEELPENGKVWPDLLVSGATLVLPGQPPVRADVMVDFEQPLLERGGRIADIGDLAGAGARRTIRAEGLYLLPHVPPDGSDVGAGSFLPGVPAYFHLSRDPAGTRVVWTLAGDVDPALPAPTGR